MNSLVYSQRLPLYLTKPSPPWKSKSPVLLPAIFQNQYNPSSLKCQLNANAKGFTSRKSPHIMKEKTLDLNIETNSNKNNRYEDDELPKEVVNRIIKRILVSVGVPMALGLTSLKFFGTVKEQGVDVPVWVIFITTFLTFGSSALGIAYGALSTSLDPNKKGSLLGFEEIQENWVEMWKEEEGNM